MSPTHSSHKFGFVLFLICLSGSYGLAAEASISIIQGSTPTHRTTTDTNFGEVLIYVGGSLPAGTTPVSLQYCFDLTTAGNTTGYITPLLFYRSPGEFLTTYTVVGIGKGFEVDLTSCPQMIPFDVIEGIKVPSNGNFTFGFVNSLVNSSGVPTVSSQGVIDFDGPADSGNGVGGTSTTNDWAASLQGYATVGLGTTFSAGANTNYSFFLPPRTYSAEVIGTVAAP
jgi:hypothetical protein